MANRTVSIWKYVKLNAGWRYCRPVEANDKIDPHYVHVNGHAEKRPGKFYLHWLENGKQHWERIGNLKDALKARESQQARLAAIEHGHLPPTAKNAPKTIAAAITAFLDEYRIGRDGKTYQQMCTTLREFQQSCKKQLLTELDKTDVMNYWQWAFDNSPTHSRRTASNKTFRVHSFLKANGIILIASKPNEKQWRIPKYTEEIPEVYTDEELDKFFAECNAYQLPVYRTFLQLGLREMELVFLSKDDLDLKSGTLRVKEKPDYDFDVKMYRERDIPIPDDLLVLLRKHCEHAKGNLVFSTKDGKPNFKLWRTGKRIARRAKIDPGRVWLHKFSASFATRLLLAGVDVRTVMYLGGWKDMKSAEPRWQGVDFGIT